MHLQVGADDGHLRLMTLMTAPIRHLQVGADDGHLRLMTLMTAPITLDQ